MSRKDNAEYLKHWKEQKALEDPDYFRRAGKKAYEKRKKLLEENPELSNQVYIRGLELSKKRRRLDPRKALLADARKRAKAKGMEYSLCLDDIPIPEICPVLGIRLVVGGECRSNSPSLDRIDNSKGYIKGNVAIISQRANMIKNDASIEEIRAILTYMEGLNALVW